MVEIYGKRMRKHIDLDGGRILPFGTPAPLHGVNPRNMMSQSEWDEIRRETYKKYDYKCAICSASGLDQGFNHPVEAHEIWDYDFDTYTQHFEGLVALCPICHKIYHYQQGLMAYQSGKLSREEYLRIERLKSAKLAEINPNSRMRVLRDYKWHDADWKSDFSKLKELYPNILMKPFFDTQWSGYYGRIGDGYVYEPVDDPDEMLF